MKFKSSIAHTIIALLTIQTAAAQSVGIGTSTPDPSARLQVNSTNQGILLPKLTAAQRASINNPATGLLVFQTDGTAGFYFYAGGGWINLTTGVLVNAVGVALTSTYGVTTTLAGSGDFGDVDGPGNLAQFSEPSGVAVDAFGNLYLADRSNHKIKKITTSGVVITYAGNEPNDDKDGPRLEAGFTRPTGVAVDADGNVYVADEHNNKIKKIQIDGEVITLAGDGAPDTTNGPAASASFWFPAGVAVDAAGNVFVADTRNNKIRKIAGGVVTTFAGSGSPGSDDGIGGEASFSSPHGVAVDAFGNVYVADRLNNKIRKITPDRVVTTFAGTGATGSDNGPRTTATFSFPNGIAIDAFGNMYVADLNSNKIRKISPAGEVSTLAGSGDYLDQDDTGPAASFAGPMGVAVDASGNVYVADAGNRKVRKIIAR